MCRSIAKDRRKKGDATFLVRVEKRQRWNHKDMRADSAATEGRKIDGWAESKNFPLQPTLGFPLVGTSHESRRDIYSVDSRAFPNFRRQIRRHRIIAVSSERTMRFFFLPDGWRDWGEFDEWNKYKANAATLALQDREKFKSRVEN